MYKEQWTIETEYTKGDIVYTLPLVYYICTISHTSDCVVYPSSEDIYWMVINKNFIYNVGASFLEAFGGDGTNTGTNTGTGTGAGAGTAGSGAGTAEPQKSRKRKIEASGSSTSKKIKTIHEPSRRDRINDLAVDKSTRAFLIEKCKTMETSSDSEKSKNAKWIDTVLSIPFGKTTPFTVNDIKDYFKKVKEILDKTVYGLEDVKKDIMQFIARKIMYPDSKGKILALCSEPGCAKTKLIKSLSEALQLPLHQINFGGLNDVSVLNGHSETYVGSKPGKFVEILAKSECMNPIIYLDEIDKIAERKETEINGILTHALDHEQNDKFQDQYLSNINIDLSKVFFIIAFNDISKINRVVLDRLEVIHIPNPSITDKIVISREKIIPEILDLYTGNPEFKYNIVFPNDLIEYTIHNKTSENGVRELKKCFEKIFNTINYVLMLQEPSDLKIDVKKRGQLQNVHVTRKFIDSVLICKTQDDSYKSMYV